MINRRMVVTSMVGALAASGLASHTEAQSATPSGATATEKTFQMAMVPLITDEMEEIYPELEQVLGEGGILYKKEVFAYVPSTVVVNAGDTVTIDCANPSPDDHTLTFPELQQSVSIPSGKSAKLTLKDLKSGIYKFTCEIPEHMPYMWGQLVVL